MAFALEFMHRVRQLADGTDRATMRRAAGRLVRQAAFTGDQVKLIRLNAKQWTVASECSTKSWWIATASTVAQTSEESPQKPDDRRRLENEATMRSNIIASLEQARNVGGRREQARLRGK
jgi:succinylarginine dihydrolase